MAAQNATRMRCQRAADEAGHAALRARQNDTLLSRLDDKRTGAIVVVMQRVHIDDLTGFLLDQSDKWDVLSLPAIADHPFVAPPPHSGNDALSTFCQDVLRSPLLNDQPFFEPARVRSMMDYIATIDLAERAPYGAMVMTVVSACILQQRFGLSAS
jgi:hypothetical protein